MRERENENRGRTFLSGVFFMTLSTLLVKIIGLIYKIPMLAYLGSEGMGYFNSAYELYAFLCVIATAGLPVALSVLISGALAEGRDALVGRIFRTSLLLFAVLGVAGSLGMYFFAGRFCTAIRSEGALQCIRAISPTVLLICLSSALRGYFQGYSRMLPTAVSQLVEAGGKLAFGLWFATEALERGADTPTVAAAAGWGLTVGTLLSLLYLCITYVCRRPSTKQNALPVSDGESTLWPLVRLGLPMTVSAALVSLARLLDMAMILRGLGRLGMSETLANEAYGSYTTLALSVFGLLPSLITSVALPLVPLLSSSVASGDRGAEETLVATSYRWTALFSIPASLGVTAFARPILALLFGHDPTAVEQAAPLLSALGISVFLSCMITATNAVLHAYRIVVRPILSMLFGTLIKLLLAYFLIANPRVGLLGAPISTFFCSATVVLCNLAFAAQRVQTPGLFGIFFRPLGASILSVGIGYGVYLWLGTLPLRPSSVTLLSIALTALLYLVLAVAFGAVGREDLATLVRKGRKKEHEKAPPFIKGQERIRPK